MWKQLHSVPAARWTQCLVSRLLRQVGLTVELYFLQHLKITSVRWKLTLTTFLMPLIEPVNRLRTFSSSLMWSVWRRHMNKTCAGRQGGSYLTTIDGLRSMGRRAFYITVTLPRETLNNHKNHTETHSHIDSVPAQDLRLTDWLINWCLTAVDT